MNSGFTGDLPRTGPERRASISEAVALPRSIAQLEDELVAVHGLWWRTPGAGCWPFAGDGPWHLIQGEGGDWAGDGVDGVSSSAVPRPALDRRDVARRERVTAWLGLIDVADRRVVHAGTLALWRGEARVPWGELARGLRWGKSVSALAWAYRKALAVMLCRLHGLPARHWRDLLKGDGLAEVPDRAAMVLPEAAQVAG